MDDQSRNLILATALSFLVILVLVPALPAAPAAGGRARDRDAAPKATTAPPADGQTPAPELAAAAPQSPRGGARPRPTRVPIRTARLTGSLSLVGGRIDDLKLTDYHVTVDPKLAARHAADARRRAARLLRALRLGARRAGSPSTRCPGPTRPGRVESGETLTETTPVTLVWDNGAGLVFRQTIVGRRELHVHRDPVGREPHRRARSGSRPTASSPATARRPT